MCSVDSRKLPFIIVRYLQHFCLIFCLLLYKCPVYYLRLPLDLKRPWSFDQLIIKKSLWWLVYYLASIKAPLDKGIKGCIENRQHAKCKTCSILVSKKNLELKCWLLKIPCNEILQLISTKFLVWNIGF